MFLPRKPMIAKNVWTQLCASLLTIVAVGCSSQNSSSDGSETDAQTMWMKSANTDDASVQKALSSALAVRINLQTNRASLYKGGKIVDQWNIASADVTGEFHDQIPQSTPTGIFAVEDMQVCPEWLPRAPKDPKTGKTAANEQERMAIIKANPELFGACGAKNPLGSYVIWFHGEYGVHGNAAEWILEIADAEQRRVSGGCIRSPNSKIKELFHTVVDSFPVLAGFKNSVLGMEKAASKDKKTLTQSLSNVDMKVVVGRWTKDPSLNANPTPEPGKTPTAAPTATPTPAVASKKMNCTVTSVDPVIGIAPYHAAVPTKPWNQYQQYDGFLSMGDTVVVTEEVAGTNYVKTTRGFVEKKYISNCRIQN
jgi:lipoprotein-anchoring transpeptidase ErfK/SrfK